MNTAKSKYLGKAFENIMVKKIKCGHIQKNPPKKPHLSDSLFAAELQEGMRQVLKLETEQEKTQR